jgi:malate dehydrogenase (oxaloacetate-decarboxylating)(NADP+)
MLHLLHFQCSNQFPIISQGLAFSIEERQTLGIHGLLPAAVKTDEEQIAQAHTMLERCANDLDRYIFLMGLQDRNERLFYRVLASDIGNMMPLVYTPTVGKIFSHLLLLSVV